MEDAEKLAELLALVGELVDVEVDADDFDGVGEDFGEEVGLDDGAELADTEPDDTVHWPFLQE